MSVGFKSFLHVERLDDTVVDVAGYLDGDAIYCFPKVDGTSAVVWASDGEIHYGGRKRELSLEDNNAHFFQYITEADGEVAQLRQFCLDHEGLVLYGEYIGHVPQAKRFIGAIKTYIEGGFFIFAVFDVERQDYIPYPEYAAMLDGVYDKVIEPITVLDHPSLEDVQAIVDDNHFNLPETEIGEGIVIYHYGYRDLYKNHQICKIVRAEYKEAKRKAKKVYTAGEIEQEFADSVITSAFMDKCRNKVCQMLDADKFDIRNAKHVNIFLNLLVTDSISEDIYTFVKRKKFPVIDFGNLKGRIMSAGREFLGL